ncbi:hypothetical protein [Streptomyces sp. WG7]|uniref:hypothetical protein n=1 Tax=Streptomyces sp. WG7 TaxID=3417650 RepID=UPI003CF99B8D
MIPGRITWGGTNPAGTNPPGTNPAGTAATGTGQNGTGQNGNGQNGTGPDADKTDILPSAAPATPAAPAAPATPATPATQFFKAAPAAPTRAFPTTEPGPATSVLRDPWQDTPDAVLDAGVGAGGLTHDPHEVTVQLDAVQLTDGVIRRVDVADREGGPESSDGPVFVDASGRRSRLYRRLGIAVGVACAIYAVVIVSTLLSGNSNAPWLPVEGQQKDKPAGQVDTTPLPSQSAQPSGTGSAAPRTDASADAGTTPAPGADGPAPGASGTALEPGTSAGPEPSATEGDTTPGGGATAPDPDPDPTQSTQVPPPGTADPSTPTDGGETPVDPTQPPDPTTGTGPGDDGTTVNGASGPLSAAGPADRRVVTVAGPDHIPTSASLSPENTL